MNGKADVKGAQGTEKSRGGEEKIKVFERPGADAGELKRRYLLRRFWKSAAGFWGKRRGAVRRSSLPTCLASSRLDCTVQSAGCNVAISRRRPPTPAGRGPVARAGHSCQEYPLIKDSCYKVKIFLLVTANACAYNM
jgi:hypothetical protein